MYYSAIYDFLSKISCDLVSNEYLVNLFGGMNAHHDLEFSQMQAIQTQNLT